MKRSEMLSAIRKGLETKPFNPDNFEQDILEVVEKLGMSPPSYCKTESCGCCSNYYEDQWEPENE